MEERFWAKVDQDGPVPEKAPLRGPCWLWTASHASGGYGQFCAGEGKTVRAHRFAYELLIGPIPVGLMLDHVCGQRLCVNPSHLEPVTAGENARRAARFGAATGRRDVRVLLGEARALLVECAVHIAEQEDLTSTVRGWLEANESALERCAARA